MLEHRVVVLSLHMDLAPQSTSFHIHMVVIVLPVSCCRCKGGQEDY